MTIQTKATEQYFPMVLFVTVDLSFESLDKTGSVAIQMKATEQ